MKLLELERGAFVVYTTCRGKYNVYVRKVDGHYHCYGNVTEQRLDDLIHAWSNIMYLYK